MEYHWNYDLIKRRIKNLELKQYLSAKEKMALAQLRTLIGIYDDYAYFKYNKKDNDILPIIQERSLFFNEISILDDVKTTRRKELNLNIDEILSIVHDFYFEQDDIIKNLFLDVFAKRDEHLNLGSRESFMHYVSFFQEPYVNIEKSKTISLLLDTIHEYGHVICSLLNNEFNNNKIYSLIAEVGSIYFQKNFLDYAVKNNIFPSEVVNDEIRYDKFIKNASIDILKSDAFLECWSDCCYFNSFLIAIELYMNPNGIDNFKKIVFEKPKSMYDGTLVADKYVEVNKSIDAYQKKLLKLKSSYEE